MILHLSHIFLTEGRTFIIKFLSVYLLITYLSRPAAADDFLRSYLFAAIGDPPAVRVVHGKFDRNLVTRQDLDVMHTHLAGNVSQYLVAVLELNPKHSVGQCFEDCALKFDNILFCQRYSFAQIVSKQQR